MTKTKRIASEAAVASAPSNTPVSKPRKKATSQPAQALPYAPDATKHQRILALLQRDTGASIADLQSATNWQAHSVRGFLSATVRKKLQLPLIAELRGTGERVYRIAVDESAHA